MLYLPPEKEYFRRNNTEIIKYKKKLIAGEWRTPIYLLWHQLDVFWIILRA
jgi:hypothetical protein